MAVGLRSSKVAPPKAVKVKCEEPPIRAESQAMQKPVKAVRLAEPSASHKAEQHGWTAGERSEDLEHHAEHLKD